MRPSPLGRDVASDQLAFLQREIEKTFNFKKYLGTDTYMWYFAGLRHLFLILIFAIAGFALDKKERKDSK